jgi:pimeloyl-ACP methyl ester carboxylesterase
MAGQDGAVSPTSLPAVVRRDVPTPAGPVAVLEAGGTSGTSGTGGTGGTAGGREHPVLLVPGYTGSKEDLAPVLPALAADGWRLVAMDQRGQFETPGPDDPAAYTIDALAADVLAVVATLGGKAHLVGHSFGGLVCRAATIADPGAVASLTLLDSGPAAIGGNRRERMAALEPLLAAGGLTAVYAGLELLAAGDPVWVAAPVEHKDFLRRRFLAGSETALRAMGDSLRAEPDRTADLRATGVPVLVAYGEHDDGWTPEVQAEMAARLGAAHAVIPGAIHSPAVQQPAATVRVLHDFWTRASPSL